MTFTHRPCTVYGDDETCTLMRSESTAIAARSGLQPAAWFQDPTGAPRAARPVPRGRPRGRPAHSAANAMPLLVPYAADVPSEQTLRLVAHWLDRHGLPLFVGHRERLWSCATDELDFAIPASARRLR